MLLCQLRRTVGGRNARRGAGVTQAGPCSPRFPSDCAGPPGTRAVVPHLGSCWVDNAFIADRSHPLRAAHWIHPCALGSKRAALSRRQPPLCTQMWPRLRHACRMRCFAASHRLRSHAALWRSKVCVCVHVLSLAGWTIHHARLGSEQVRHRASAVSAQCSARCGACSARVPEHPIGYRDGSGVPIRQHHPAHGQQLSTRPGSIRWRDACT